MIIQRTSDDISREFKVMKYVRSGMASHVNNIY